MRSIWLAFPDDTERAIVSALHASRSARNSPRFLSSMTGSRLNFRLEARAVGSGARAASFSTAHNEVHTPLFMPAWRADEPAPLDVVQPLTAEDGPVPQVRALAEVEKEHILTVLSMVGGNRSLAAKLLDAGFKKVTVLDEGLGAWSQKNYPVRRGEKP